MDAVRAAVERYEAGQAMDLDSRLPDSVKMVLSAFEAPANVPLARELLAENATQSLPEVKIPTLVMIGGKDLQVDARSDGDPLQVATTGMANMTFAFPPHANHVFKQETRTPDEVVAATGNGYNENGTQLDPEALKTILSWLRTVFA